MQGLTHRWIGRDGGPGPGSAPLAAGDASPARGVHAGSAADDCRPDRLYERILRARGYVDPAEVADFCSPRLLHLHSPALLPGIDAASERLLRAVKSGETITIYGDYDVDGITGAAILYHILRAIRPDAAVRIFIPHRIDDGYGLSAEALRRIRADGSAVVVSVDCGVTAVEPARVAREIGLDLIITDHHNPPAEGEPWPHAVAIVHPAGVGAEYPFRDLCGAGVAFKLAWRLATVHCGSERVSEAMRDVLMSLLPLAALGTIADVVPLIGENRVLASIGLRLLADSQFVGIRALIEAVGLRDRSIDCEKVGFILAPHLNACGRMDHAADAVRLLTDADAHECRAIAGRLAQMNRDRQRTQREIQDAAARLAEDRGMTRDDCRIIVLSHPAWHRGVVGIVCSRLTELFGRPSILMQEEAGHCFGSARSIEGYSIVEALDSCDDLLAAHGGHDMAAGLSLEAANLDVFTSRMIEHANARIDAAHLSAALRIDTEAGMDELTVEQVREVARLAPFGRSNPKPVVVVRNVVVGTDPRQIGSEGRHLSLRLRDGDQRDSRWLAAVWWNGAAHARSLPRGTSVDVAFEPRLNSWNRRVDVQAVIRDVRLLGADSRSTSRVTPPWRAGVAT